MSNKIFDSLKESEKLFVKLKKEILGESVREYLENYLKSDKFKDNTCTREERELYSKYGVLLDLMKQGIIKENNIAKEIIEEEAEKEKLKRQYIFDKEKIINSVPFAVHKINEDIFGFGLYLPKERDSHDKKGNIVGKEQVFSPVSITSGHKMLEANNKILESLYKKRFDPLPQNIPLRWSLKSIDEWLDRKEEEINPLELFNKIKALYEKFLYFRGETWYSVHALWDMGTYLFILFSAYPLLELRGLSGTAKTKVMKISRLMTLNATPILINPSEATLFRETHEKSPTKYIDEAEKLFKHTSRGLEPDNRVEIINGSYSKGSTVSRQEGIMNNKFITRHYNCYSPLMIGSINGLYGATETRAITHIMTKSPDNDERGNLEVEEDEEQSRISEIRDGLYVFALQNWSKIEEIYKNLEIETTLKKRDFQLWKPLLVIAKLIDKNLFETIKNFAEKISKQKREDFIPEGSFDYKILSIVKELLDRGENKIRPKAIRGLYSSKFVSDDVKIPGEKSISNRLDVVGFKELRSKDREGSYFEISKELFESIISTICPDFSSQSSQSSQKEILSYDTEKI